MGCDVEPSEASECPVAVAVAAPPLLQLLLWFASVAAVTARQRVRRAGLPARQTGLVVSAAGGAAVVDVANTAEGATGNADGVDGALCSQNAH